MTGSCVMRISIEGYFRAICKVTFYVSRIFLLLPDLCVVLVLIFVIYIICLVYLMLCCFSSLVSVNVVSKSLGRFGCFDRRSTFTDVDSWSLQLVLVILFWLEMPIFSNMLINLQGTVGIFKSWLCEVILIVMFFHITFPFP